MAPQKRASNFTWRALSRCGGLAAFYLLLIFLLPPNRGVMSDHNLTAPEYHILLFLIVLPSVTIWFVAFYGYAKLQEYAEFIKKTPESKGFGQLARGCQWLAWSLPVSAIASITVNGITNISPDFRPVAAILVNYLNLIVPLVGFSFIGMASRNLISRAKTIHNTSLTRLIMLLFVAVGVLYCYIVFSHFDPTSLGSTDNPYYLPLWLTLITIIVPFLYAWFIGVLAAYEIVAYTRQVNGVLYRQALQLLVGGIVAAIIAFIALQYIASIQPPSGRLSINYRLIANIGFRVIGGAGFVLIALGAIRLKKIEKV